MVVSPSAAVGVGDARDDSGWVMGSSGSAGIVCSGSGLAGRRGSHSCVPPWTSCPPGERTAARTRRSVGGRALFVGFLPLRPLRPPTSMQSGLLPPATAPPRAQRPQDEATAVSNPTPTHLSQTRENPRCGLHDDAVVEVVLNSSSISLRTSKLPRGKVPHRRKEIPPGPRIIRCLISPSTPPPLCESLVVSPPSDGREPRDRQGQDARRVQHRQAAAGGADAGGVGED